MTSTLLRLKLTCLTSDKLVFWESNLSTKNTTIPTKTMWTAYYILVRFYINKLISLKVRDNNNTIFFFGKSLIFSWNMKKYIALIWPISTGCSLSQNSKRSFFCEHPVEVLSGLTMISIRVNYNYIDKTSESHNDERVFDIHLSNTPCTHF